MVSKEIEAARESYLALMREHGTMAPSAIIDSVREKQDELMALLRSVDAERALRRPAEGEWCMHELASHGAFTERLIGSLVRHMSRGSVPPPEDLEGAGIGMLPAELAGSYAEALTALEQANRGLIDALRDLPADPNVQMKLPHPIFGPLNCLEWAAFQRVHDLDHIQHARKIIAAV